MLKTKLILVAATVFAVANVSAQIGEPKPGQPRTVTIPAVKESKLENGMTVAVIEKRNVPLVTIALLTRSGAADEGKGNAGLANITASMLTKGTKARTATQIAEQIEFLGGSINSHADWNYSFVTVSITSDKVEQAMAILADTALNPTFPQSELDLLKTQAIDGLTYSLTQPGFLTNYVASVYSFGEHPAGGTPESLGAVTRDAVAGFYSAHFRPGNSVLIFGGDISTEQAAATAKKHFGSWPAVAATPPIRETVSISSKPPERTVNRILVVDLPNSGQASVSYALRSSAGRRAADANAAVSSGYYPALTLNSLLGGGYSSRLNQEIRIKRGLSYGAGSGFSWRPNSATFGTRTQTKNESAPEVAELVIAEIERLANDETITAAELDPRKSVLTGGFGRSIETTTGLVNALGELYAFGLAPTELNRYMTSVNSVTDKQIREFARTNLRGGDIIIVGDYAKFKDDLAKRFAGREVTVVPAAKLNINSKSLL